jgi:hypothetical protein
MFFPYLVIFRQLFTFWNRCIALDLKSIYFHVIALLLLTVTYVCLRTTLPFPSALFGDVHVSVMYNICLLSNAKMYYYYTNLLLLYVCVIFLCIYMPLHMYVLTTWALCPLYGCLVWLFSLIYLLWGCLCCYLLNTGHTYGAITDTIDVIRTGRKGRHLNTLEKYHIYKISRNNLHMNNIYINIFNSIQSHWTPN